MRKNVQTPCATISRSYPEGCNLLAEVKEGVITKEKREKIFSHRHEELLTRVAYDRFQRQLWRFLSDTEEPAPVTRLDGSPEPKRIQKSAVLKKVGQTLVDRAETTVTP